MTYRDQHNPHDLDGTVRQKVEFAIALDDILHFRGVCCGDRKCRKCSTRTHFQGIYGGYIEVCESCDADEFRPAVRDASVEGGHFLQADVPAGCDTTPCSSRACECGTRTCTVVHGWSPEQQAERARIQKRIDDALGPDENICDHCGVLHAPGEECTR